MSQTFTAPAGTDNVALAVRQYLVDRDEALRTLFSGSSAPSSPSAYQLWADTSSKILKQRNGSNSAWVEVLPLADTVRLSQPLQLSGALAAATLLAALPMAAKVLRVLVVPSATTSTSVATTKEWTFALRNLTTSLDLFSATPSTATTVVGVGGGEMTANTAYSLTSNQNSQVAANDVLRLTIAQNGSPTAVSNCSIVLVYSLVGA